MLYLECTMTENILIFVLAAMLIMELARKMNYIEKTLDFRVARQQMVLLNNQVDDRHTPLSALELYDRTKQWSLFVKRFTDIKKYL